MSSVPLKVYVAGAKCLSAKSRAVPVIDEPVRVLADAMVEAMRTYDGCGLAAPQVGVNLRLIVLEIPMPKDGVQSVGEALLLPAMPIAMVNPEILSREGEMVSAEEGCLSVPSVYAPVERQPMINLRYTGLDGFTSTVHCAGLLARAVQHEVDHLDGFLFLDRLKIRDLRKVRPAVEKIMAEAEAAGHVRTEVANAPKN